MTKLKEETRLLLYVFIKKKKKKSSIDVFGGVTEQWHMQPYGIFWFTWFIISTS